jgi:flagellar protein FliS
VGYDQNPYQAYTDGSIFSGNPLNQVVALYQAAIDATNQAGNALRAGDIMGRSKAINKALAILTELLASLDYQQGGEISANLKRLYGYMQARLLTAHARQSPEPIAEVSALLSTLLEGWRGAALAQTQVAEGAPAPTEYAAAKPQATAAPYLSAPVYSGYADEGAGSFLSKAYSF